MELESENFVIGAEQPVTDIKPGVSRKLLAYTQELMTVRVSFNEDAVGKRPPLHHHPHVQITYVISGKFEAHIEDQVKTVGPGDTYRVPSNVPHEAYCIEPGEVLDIFTPMREDFLSK